MTNARGLGVNLAFSVLLFGGLGVLFYLASTHVAIGNSDGATVILEGQSMAHGNVLLHGWSLSLDSFWTIDAVFYMVAVLLVGVHGALLHVVPAVIAACVVLIGMWLAREERRGARSVVGPLIVFSLLGLPSPALAYFLVQGALHVGTVLYCLVAFVGISTNRIGWKWLVAVVALSAGILGDAQTFALGIAPIVAAGLIAMARRRNLRSGVFALGGALAAVALSAVVRLVGVAIGTFRLVRTNPTAHGHEIAINFHHLPRYVSGLFGVGNIPIGTPAPAGALVLQILRVFGLAAVIGAVVVGVVLLVRALARGTGAFETDYEPWRMDDLLVVGFVFDLATFVFLSSSGNADYSRYLTAGAVFAAVLAGRYGGRLAARMASNWRAKVVASCAALILCVYACGFAIGLSRPEPTQPASALASFLSAHHLKNGIGDYWSASIVTVEAGGDVVVRPVIVGPSHQLVRYGRQAPDSWYVGQRFSFFVCNLAHPWRGVNIAAALASFGAPAHAYSVGTYRVLVWRAPVHLANA